VDTVTIPKASSVKAGAALRPWQDVSHVAVVLPCLDEEESLLSTCRSLGFGTSGEGQAPQAVLFIVDNGSTDDTVSVAREIQDASLPGTVIIGREEERGYVPPRHRGNGFARSFAEANGIYPDQVLVLQADADTLYQQDYIERMRLAAQAGANTLLEARAEFPPGFQNSFPGYIALLAETDDRFFRTINFRAPVDLVCTDAVCGYRLSDYLAWGGHIREYREDGEEIHAETTRLRIRSVAHGAVKVLVEDAVALPSERKTLLRPAEEFAMAGFPREPGWRAAWRRRYSGPNTAEAFGAARDHPEVMEAIRLRQRHLVSLFGLLPLHAATALDAPPVTADPRLLEIVVSLPARDANTLLHRPGQLLVDVLEVVDHRGAALDALFGGGTGASRH
jgi:glycosyltransferase involved in cell wall biosynthesis